MKRTFTFFMALATYALCHGQQPSISSVYPNSGFPGQNINVSLIAQNYNFYQTTAIGMVWLENFWIPSNSYTVLSPTQMTVNFSIPANAPAQVFNFFPSQFASGNFTVLSGNANLSYVEGVVYQDLNTNCVNNFSDPKVSGATVTLNPGGYSTISGANGVYNAWVPPGNYTATITPPPGYNATCPVSLNWPVNIPMALDSMMGADFGVQSTPYQDVQVCYSSSPLRPGFPRAGSVIAVNYGNIAYTGQVTLVHDTMVVPGIGNFSIAPNSYSGDTAVWNVSLAPGATFTCNTNFTGNLNAQIGDTSYFTVWADTSGTEAVPANNRFTDAVRVSNSWDPNDKAVRLVSGANADGFITHLDSALVYRVRFQNTGTDTAYNVVIRDTLDPDLDPSTVRVLSASHAYNFAMNPTGGMEFSFFNIMLPDSFVNEPASNGYIIYQVKQRPNLPDGTTIDNSASIYFDFNAPVVTNTVTSTVCTAVFPGYSYAVTGSAVAFTDQSSGPILSRTWNFGDGNTSTLLNPSHTYAAPGVYNVCLTTTTACYSETHCTWVTICQEPTAAFQNSPSQLSVAFTDQSSSGITQWQWDFGDGNSSTQQNPSHSYALPGSYLVCLTVTDSCSMASFCDTVVVTCIAPSAAFTWSQSQLQASFTNQISGQSGATYAWDFGDGNSGTGANPMHTYSSGGSYLACLTVTDVCGTSTFCDSVTVVCLAPAAAFGFQANGSQVQFNDQTPGTIVSRLWDFGDGNTSTQASPMHNYSGTGSYTACLTVTNDCGGMDTTCQTISVVGISEGPFRSVAIYPNPNSGRFTLDAVLDAPGHLRLRVFDLQGRLLAGMDLGEVQGSLRRQIDLGELPKGGYFLQFDLDGRRENRIFMIED